MLMGMRANWVQVIRVSAALVTFGTIATSAALAVSTPTPKASADVGPPRTGSQYSRYVDAYWKSQAEYVAAQQRYNESAYTQSARQARLNTDAYERQASEDPVIMWVVILVVLVGIGLSIAQVAKGFIVPARVASNFTSIGSAEKADNAPTPPSGPASTFKATMSGIEFSSASIGLMILAVSLAFFFLYLKFVYTIAATGS
jgi:hypothetical protein